MEKGRDLTQKLGDQEEGGRVVSGGSEGGSIRRKEGGGWIRSRE